MESAKRMTALYSLELSLFRLAPIGELKPTALHISQHFGNELHVTVERTLSALRPWEYEALEVSVKRCPQRIKNFLDGTAVGYQRVSSHKYHVTHSAPVAVAADGAVSDDVADGQHALRVRPYAPASERNRTDAERHRQGSSEK